MFPTPLQILLIEPLQSGFGALIAYERQKSSGEAADDCPWINEHSEAEGIHPKASLRTQEERRGKELPLSYSCACRESLK